MIEGFNVRCLIGPLDITRSPQIEIISRRRAVVGIASVVIPDPEGTVRASLAVGQPVDICFGYRGEDSLWQEWEGSISGIDQPHASAPDADAVSVRCVGQEQSLATTRVTESFLNEPADVVARRLLAKTGLSVGNISIPSPVLPHQVFSNCTVARAIKQLGTTLERSYGCDMHRHALWLGASGLTWSDGDEPGDEYRVATAENLIAHTPPLAVGGIGVVTSVVLPGLTHSRLVHVYDSRRGIDDVYRALSVIHTLEDAGNTTQVTYGTDEGWS